MADIFNRNKQMSSSAHETSVIGTDGNDFITVERNVSFVWVPAAGNASVVEYYDDYWDNSQLYYRMTGPSMASGMVTFPGASSGEPFQSDTTDVGFRFTDLNAFLPWDTSQSYSLWSYDPATGVLDPDMVISDWDGLDSAQFRPNSVAFQRIDKNGSGNSDTEYGHWQLAGLWRFLLGVGHACMGIGPALLTFESDAFHCFCSHGGAIDADRKARVTGKIVALETL